MRKRTRWAWAAGLAAAAVVYAVGMLPTAGTPVAPRFHPEQFFNGSLDSWGVFVDMNGNPDQRFSMHAEASWDADKGRMHEKFLFADGVVKEREWTFIKTSPAHFVGTASDVEGEARGVVSGDSLHWVYTIKVPVQGKIRSVTFDDWLYQIDANHVFSEVRASKFGIPVGHMTMFFEKHP